MITRAKFQCFKSLRDVEVTFDSRLTVIVGPNGAGKTSVLQGIHFLCEANKDVLTAQIGGMSEYLSVGAALADFVLEVEAGDATGAKTSLTISATPASKNGQPIQSQRQPLSFAWRSTAPKVGEWFDRMPPENAALPLGPAQLIRFDTTALASPTQPKGIPPSVQENGNGLAATLGYLALNQPEQFQAIVSEYKKVIRNVSRIRFNEQQQGNGTTKSLLFDFLGAPGVRASLVSSGTLYTLGLLTVILGPNQPRVILFDDLDHGLHPKAQMELIEVLRKLLDQYPDLQIIATSHSPYILDKLQPNEVRVMALNDDGSAACARLEDHPKYPMWKDSMSPGEFWSHAGEDWVKKLHLEPVAQ